jgi:hypothetical protein
LEIVPGIPRLESHLGKKLVTHYLLTGDRTLLVDAGTAQLAQEDIVPQIKEVQDGAAEPLPQEGLLHDAAY